ncbi:HET domain containing protein [Alternaria alternata]|nr:HET domain containing protein [Alternaria alternata]
MFRWYKDATLCYAYLDDVSVYDARSDDWFSNDELAKSRWFTRGWTLQELIAPKNIVFYGKDWISVGQKALCCAKQERITGTSANVLAGTDAVEDQSIAKRMSWMSGRTTTRTEDMACSLMGIFDVNMPLLYGEGDKAFVRLQEEIMKDSADHSLFAWQESYSSGYFLPNSIFSGDPEQFGASSGIVNRRFDDNDRLNEEFSSTNRGVKIKPRVRKPINDPLNVLKLGEDHFLAVLDCCMEDPKFKNCWPAITITQLTGSKSQYIRLAEYPIVPVVFGPVSDAHKLSGVVSVGEADGGEWIYLRKRIPGWVMP